jgi:hypothetical protein
MAAEGASIPNPQAAWVRSTMTEAKIQVLVDHGLLRLKAKVEWRVTAREQFPSEDVKEQVVFASFFERGFNLPTGDFLPWAAVLLRFEVGIPRPQLHYRSIDVHSLL